MSPPLGLKLVIIFLLLTCRPTGAMAGNHIDIIFLLKPWKGGMSIAKALSDTPQPRRGDMFIERQALQTTFSFPFMTVYRHVCFI